MTNDRREFPETLSDGKEYTFAERNFEDVDIAALHERTRKAMARFAREHFDKENLFAHEMQILRITPTDQEMGSYLGTTKEIKRSCYDSFKISNEKISFEEFDKLLPDKNVNDVMDKIIEIEFQEKISDADLAKETGVTLELLARWKKELPQLYFYISRNVKKKRVKD